MIVVVADDLSGAAELAGAARRFGLESEVQTTFVPDAPARVVCIDSGGREEAPDAAAAGIRRLLREVESVGPEWVYLKFDSVLRGNIAAELRAALDTTRLDRAVLITANPRRGRTIRDGVYLVDGVPLHETTFAEDPEYPCRTSSVRELVGGESGGILIPDVERPEDLAILASSVDDRTLVAGSAEFFEALLAERVAMKPSLNASVLAARSRPLAGAGASASTLLVCGSRAVWPARVGEARRCGVTAYDLLDDPRTIAGTLARDGVALLGIGTRLPSNLDPPHALVAKLAEAAAAVTAISPPARLLLEGGATAAAVIRRFGWTRLRCLDGVGRGVGTLRPPGTGDPLVLIKPGSYPWPHGAW